MRGSAVVQGLKDLASKLHPQLPLSPKESQRLLNALTTSFRKQLDQAHPPQTGVNESKPSNESGTISVSRAQPLNSSSAALADRHLASVLTNPLLARGGESKQPPLNHATAAIELQKDPAKDPISLLKEYHEKSAATVPIALLCLQKFKQSIDNLPPEKQENAITQAKPGKRTLLWLWNSKLYETDAFAENVAFIDLLSLFIVKESSETYFWDMFQLHIPLEESTALATASHTKQQQHHRYRWKGRLLRAMVTTKLKDQKEFSADAALDTLFKACDIKAAALQKGVEEHQYPLSSAALVLAKLFEDSPESVKNTDSVRFDRFVERFPFCFSPDASGYIEFHTSRLALVHPRHPSPFPALEVLKCTFYQHDPHYLRVYKHFAGPHSERKILVNYRYLRRTIVLLQAHSHTEDANWVISLAHRFCPEPASKWLERDLKNYRVMSRSGDEGDRAVDRTTLGIGVPSFG